MKQVKAYCDLCGKAYAYTKLCQGPWHGWQQALRWAAARGSSGLCTALEEDGPQVGVDYAALMVNEATAYPKFRYANAPQPELQGCPVCGVLVNKNCREIFHKWSAAIRWASGRGLDNQAEFWRKEGPNANVDYIAVMDGVVAPRRPPEPVSPLSQVLEKERDLALERIKLERMKIAVEEQKQFWQQENYGVQKVSKVGDEAPAARTVDELVDLYEFQPGVTYVFWWEEKMNPMTLNGLQNKLELLGIKHLLIAGCKEPKIFAVDQAANKTEILKPKGRKFRLEEGE